jgi:tetratricopeptide (TPR) repeat protein
MQPSVTAGHGLGCDRAAGADEGEGHSQKQAVATRDRYYGAGGDFRMADAFISYSKQEPEPTRKLAADLDPNDAGAYINRGNAYVDKGKHDRALADFNKAIELDPNNALAYLGRGNAYAAIQIDRAIVDYTQAIDLDPNFAKAYYNRGVIYEDKGDKARAIADFRRALSLDPNKQDAKDALQ